MRGRKKKQKQNKSKTKKVSIFAQQKGKGWGKQPPWQTFPPSTNTVWQLVELGCIVSVGADLCAKETTERTIMALSFRNFGSFLAPCIFRCSNVKPQSLLKIVIAPPKWNCPSREMVRISIYLQWKCPCEVPRTMYFPSLGESLSHILHKMYENVPEVSIKTSYTASIFSFVDTFTGIVQIVSFVSLSPRLQFTPFFFLCCTNSKWLSLTPPNCPRFVWLFSLRKGRGCLAICLSTAALPRRASGFTLQMSEIRKRPQLHCQLTHWIQVLSG